MVDVTYGGSIILIEFGQGEETSRKFACDSDYNFKDTLCSTTLKIVIDRRV